MLKYPCLVLDHDDTVVQSEATVNYPCFLLALEKFRPGEYMDYPEFVDWCFKYEFTDFLRLKQNSVAGAGSLDTGTLPDICVVEDAGNQIGNFAAVCWFCGS